MILVFVKSIGQIKIEVLVLQQNTCQKGISAVLLKKGGNLEGIIAKSNMDKQLPQY
jgi:hypothetical protein